MMLQPHTMPITNYLGSGGFPERIKTQLCPPGAVLVGLGCSRWREAAARFQQALKADELNSSSSSAENEPNDSNQTVIHYNTGSPSPAGNASPFIPSSDVSASPDKNELLKPATSPTHLPHSGTSL